MAYQNRIDPARLVFIDETWTKTNMAPLRGWAPCGQALRIGQFNSDAVACFGRHEFNRLAKNIALKKEAEAAPAGLRFMLTRRDQEGPRSGIAHRPMPTSSNAATGSGPSNHPRPSSVRHQRKPTRLS